MELVAGVDGETPLFGAGFPVEGEEEDLVGGLLETAELLGVVGGIDEAGLGGEDVDGVGPDDGSGGTPTGHFDFPQDVFCFRPLSGEFGGFGSVAGVVWAAPSGPQVVSTVSAAEARKARAAAAGKERARILIATVYPLRDGVQEGWGGYTGEVA